MNPVDRAFVRCEKSILGSGHTTVLTVCSGASKGLRMTGRVDLKEVIDPDMELGADPRMQAVFRVLSPIPDMRVNSMLTDGLAIYKVIKMENNPASITVDFWLEQQV